MNIYVKLSILVLDKTKVFKSLSFASADHRRGKSSFSLIKKVSCWWWKNNWSLIILHRLCFERLYLCDFRWRPAAKSPCAALTHCYVRWNRPNSKTTIYRFTRCVSLLFWGRFWNFTFFYFLYGSYSWFVAVPALDRSDRQLRQIAYRHRPTGPGTETPRGSLGTLQGRVCLSHRPPDGA